MISFIKDNDVYLNSTGIIKWGGVGVLVFWGDLGPPLRVNQTMPANTLWVWLRGDVTP